MKNYIKKFVFGYVILNSLFFHAMHSEQFCSTEERERARARLAEVFGSGAPCHRLFFEFTQMMEHKIELGMPGIERVVTEFIEQRVTYPIEQHSVIDFYALVFQIFSLICSQTLQTIPATERIMLPPDIAQQPGFSVASWTKLSKLIAGRATEAAIVRAFVKHGWAEHCAQDSTAFWIKTANPIVDVWDLAPRPCPMVGMMAFYSPLAGLSQLERTRLMGTLFGGGRTGECTVCQRQFATGMTLAKCFTQNGAFAEQCFALPGGLGAFYGAPREVRGEGVLSGPCHIRCYTSVLA